VTVEFKPLSDSDLVDIADYSKRVAHVATHSLPVDKTAVANRLYVEIVARLSVQ